MSSRHSVNPFLRDFSKGPEALTPAPSASSQLTMAALADVEAEHHAMLNHAGLVFNEGLDNLNTSENLTNKEIDKLKKQILKLQEGVMVIQERQEQISRLQTDLATVKQNQEMQNNIVQSCLMYVLEHLNKIYRVVGIEANFIKPGYTEFTNSEFLVDKLFSKRV